MVGFVGILLLVVGLMVVFFGMSLLEFVVLLKVMFVGEFNLVVGNVVGSNIVNVLLVLGVLVIVVLLVVVS